MHDDKHGSMQLKNSRKFFSDFIHRHELLLLLSQSTQSRVIDKAGNILFTVVMGELQAAGQGAQSSIDTIYPSLCIDHLSFSCCDTYLAVIHCVLLVFNSLLQQSVMY